MIHDHTQDVPSYGEVFESLEQSPEQIVATFSSEMILSFGRLSDGCSSRSLFIFPFLQAQSLDFGDHVAQLDEQLVGISFFYGSTTLTLSFSPFEVCHKLRQVLYCKHSDVRFTFK